MKIKLLLLSLLLWAQHGLAANFSIRLTVSGGSSNLVDTFTAEIANLGSENEVTENTVIVGNQTIITKTPSRLHWLDITIKRGLTSSLDLANWRKMVEDGNVAGARKNATITIYDASLTPVAQWQLSNCWPSSLSLEQKPDGSFVEALRFVHEGMTRQL